MAPAYRIRARNDLLMTSWCQSRDHITPSGTWRHFATSAVEGDSGGITKYCVLDIFFWSKTSLDELKCNILLVSGSQQASDLSFLFVSHFIFFSVCGYLLLCGVFFPALTVVGVASWLPVNYLAPAATHHFIWAQFSPSAPAFSPLIVRLLFPASWAKPVCCKYLVRYTC